MASRCADPFGLASHQLSEPTYSLHCSSFLGLPFRFLNINLVKPKKGTTMETIGRCLAKRIYSRGKGSLNTSLTHSHKHHLKKIHKAHTRRTLLKLCTLNLDAENDLFAVAAIVRCAETIEMNAIIIVCARGCRPACRQ